VPCVQTYVCFFSGAPLARKFADLNEICGQVGPKREEPQLFWHLIVFYTAGRDKKYVNQYLECIIPFSKSYLNFV